MAAATAGAAAGGGSSGGGGGVGSEDFELPKTVIQRLFKAKVPDTVILSKDGRAALAEATTVFVTYVAAMANDLATAKGAKTLTAASVYLALEELGFEDFCGPVRATVDAFKQTSQERRQASSEKRKAKEAGLVVDAEGAGGTAADMDADDGPARANAGPANDDEDAMAEDADADADADDGKDESDGGEDDEAGEDDEDDDDA